MQAFGAAAPAGGIEENSVEAADRMASCRTLLEDGVEDASEAQASLEQLLAHPIPLRADVPVRHLIRGRRRLTSDERVIEAITDNGQ